MSTSSPGDTLVSLSADKENEREKMTRATYGPMSSMPFAQYDLVTHSWKTCEDTSVSDSEPFSETWPPSGLMQSGKCYLRPRLVRHTAATASSSWPTPRAAAAMNTKLETLRKSPRMGRYLATGKGLTFSRLEERLAIRCQDNGRMSPMWVEWLMGFPQQWTDLEDSETR